jgi:hypothetical protein
MIALHRIFLSVWCVLQNCVELLRYEPESSTETCLRSAGARNQVAGVKVEEGVAVKVEEEDPEPVSFPTIKTEPEVSDMYVYFNSLHFPRVRDELYIYV